VIAQHIDNMTIDDTLWKNDHGLCTSFAIRVAHGAGIEISLATAIMVDIGWLV